MIPDPETGKQSHCHQHVSKTRHFGLGASQNEQDGVSGKRDLDFCPATIIDKWCSEDE